MKRANDDLLRVARERYSEALDGDRSNRDEALDDLQFLVGEQWPDSVRAARSSEGRPIITVNRLPQFLRQVTGDIRRTNPAVSIIAGDGDASEEVAEIYDGLARQIQYECDAPSVYERAAESAAACGIGWFRILTDYESDETFDQVLKVEPIYNPFSVYVDPEARESTRADARYLFVVERITGEEFSDRYPKARAVDFERGDDVRDGMREWYSDDSVLVAEYWWKEPVKRRLARLASGRTVEMPGAKIGDLTPEGPVQAVRDVLGHVIKTCTMSGDDVLEGATEWPGRDFPIIAVTGEEIAVGDRIVRTSVVRWAKDPQRLYNYARSTQAEVVSLQPKAPFVGTMENFAGHEAKWAQANTSTVPFLPYNPDPEAPGAMPQRSAPPVASQGLAAEIALAADDMQATTGIYDAAVGARSNETSGKAIQARQLESDISTSIYVDNLAKAIWQAGKIMVDLIPVIYDTNRLVRIVGADDVEKLVEINGVAVEGGTVAPVNDLTVGRYAVRVKTGPSYTTQRQQAADSMIQFAQAVPQAAAVIGDLIAKSMDWAGADEVAERLKKLLPPGMADEEMTPEMQQMAMQQQAMQQQLAQMQQALAQIELRTKAAEAVEAEADAAKAQAEAVKARAEAGQAARGDALDAMATAAALQQPRAFTI